MADKDGATPGERETTRLTDCLEGLAGSEHAGAALKQLVHAGWGALPHPGSGDTQARWRILAAVGAHDLVLSKLLESHADALAILHELEGDASVGPGQTWAVWCAEPPDRRLDIRPAGAGKVHLHGTKAWCSAAQWVSHAVVSGWNDEGEPCLAAVDMAQPGVRVTSQGWHAVGMAGTASVDVVFDGARAVPVGAPHAYVQRPGFMHGAAGVAACWHGGASGIAARVHGLAQRRPDDVYTQTHLGALDVALAQAASLMREAAAQIDATPDDACMRAVQRARLAVEAAVQVVLERAPRAFGAGPLCKDACLARLFADLPVYIRQSHAERDLAAHGKAIAAQPLEHAWTL
ncbi:acyl-CoA dehydrogenase family protein [Bordetella genomosp. 13]|uniref:acyl-CoA dehydrogenase family protein n=1 Tax=Bordetella genomosp. 13 TaxID=463040 RepID=UPI0021B63359|nr:acyl-CoA dehydrogenase family protein [Bordetella genomosp. 13]